MEYLSDAELKKLAEKWLNGSLTPEEELLFNQWYEQQPDEKIAVQSADDNAEDFRARVFERIMATIRPEKTENIVLFRKKRRITWAVAASLLVLIGLGGVYFRFYHPITSRTEKITATNDIAPGRNRATLTLSNGRIIYLDSSGKGEITNTGNIKIIKLDSGTITYSPQQPNASKETAYNTLETPNGGQYRIQLSDGTGVWLNAASSIRYPVSFSGTSRTVEITGEAYFEVVHNAKMPFVVKAGSTIIHDIGTHFNVNAYNNEPSMKITLLEGAIQIEQSDTKAKRLMHPGEQMSIDKHGSFSLDPHADISGAIAWKEGLFDFDGATLATAMRQISRWYNVEVDYPEGIPDIVFTGAIHRNVNISQVLDMLSYFNIRFKIVQHGERKKIIVTS